MTAASTCLSLRSTCLPSLSSTRSVLNAGSRSSVNHTFTSAGAPCTVSPTRGDAWSRNACASAACATRAISAPRTSLENRAANAARKYVIEEEVDLEKDAGSAAAERIHRHEGLERELHLAAGPDDPGIHRAGESRRAAVDRLLQIELDER